MYAVSYRATERGIRNRSGSIWEKNRERRLVAQRAAWEAEQAEREKRKLEALKRQERVIAIQEELREAGIKPNGRTFRRIEERAMKVFGVTRTEIMSKRRDQHIVAVRQFIAYWTVRLTDFSLPSIGRLMGKDHTTILHSKRQYPERRAKMGRYLRKVR